jgi:hypothetical protein
VVCRRDSIDSADIVPIQITQYIDDECRELLPVSNAGLSGASDISSVDLVAICEPRESPATGMRRDLVRIMAGLEVHVDGDDLHCCNCESHRIRGGNLSNGNSDACAAIEREVLSSGHLDRTPSCLVGCRESDGRCCDGQRSASERIGEADAEFACTDGELDGLAESRVFELCAAVLKAVLNALQPPMQATHMRRGWQVGVLCQLGHRNPSGDPVICLCLAALEGTADCLAISVHEIGKDRGRESESDGETDEHLCHGR